MTRTRNRKTAPRSRTFVFDSEALSKAVRGTRELRALIKAAPDLGIVIATSSLTTLQAWDPRGETRNALWDWTLSRIDVVHTDDELITTARLLLRRAGLHGHKYAIDAILAAVALAAAQRGTEVTVFTSDVDDLANLLDGSPVKIEKV